MTSVPTGVALTGLTKSFGAIKAVRGIDLTIDRGETVALLGPNGAGKSTTIDMMLGLSMPDAGTVTVFDTTPAAAVASGQICGMLQIGSLLPYLTVRELLTQIASLYPDALGVDDVIELTGIAGFAGQRTNKLSGGQIQRARFAIALVSNSDLLVLDEPTVAMDVEGRHQFWSTMREVAAAGKTVIFATHYLEEADSYADRIVLMANGRIVADGPSTEIKALVGSRVIRATLPSIDRTELALLPGVTVVERRGEAIVLTCSDSDQAVRALLSRYSSARDIEVTGAGLEQAFLQLTGGDAGHGAGDELVADTADTADLATPTPRKAAR